MDTFGVTFTSNCTVTLEVRASNLDDAIKRAEKEARAHIRADANAARARATHRVR